MKTKTVASLLKRVTTRNMFPSEVDRLKRLLAYMLQFHRLKFEEATPQEYLDVTSTLELLIPSEMRLESYARYEVACLPTYDFVGETITNLLASIVRKTMSNNVKVELNKIIEAKMYEPTDLPDVSSTDSAETPPQQVPDNDEPYAKKSKKIENQSD